MKSLTAIAILLLAISTAWAKDGASIYKSNAQGATELRARARRALNWQVRRGARMILRKC